MDAFVEILLGLTLAGIVVLLVWRRHLKKKKDNMRKESLSNDECASAVDLTLFPEVKDNSEESLLIHCPACGLEVSRYAPTCPRCGHSIYLIRPLQQETVIEVTLTTVKVQNWDNTITTIPPYALVSDSFQNWRGMRESGGRRIKRSLNIDMTTVHFCTPQQLKNFEKRGWLEGFERTGKEEVNLHVFRHYLEQYLRHHPRVNTSLTLMVRQLQPTPQGLPIELYFFSANKDWIPYERLQAEVFDHVLAVLPQFGLKVFQSPTGTDILALSKQ